MRTQSSTTATESLKTIADAGGHFVLVKRGEKRPVWGRWQKRKPSLDVVAAHDGRIGLIPHSIGATALDVDQGDPSKLPPPWTRTRSQRAGGFHLYYGDDQARGNQSWEAEGCSGEVRSASGYLILHNGGEHKLARAIESGRQKSLFPFPFDLLKLHEAELIVPTVRKLHAVETLGKVSVRLEGVFEGARGESLFLVVREWAYKQRRGPDLRAWCRLVKDFTIHSNNRFPVPLEAREAIATSYSVATWIWSTFNEVVPTRGKAAILDHSSMAQSWRGTRGGLASGVSRRRSTHARDRAIVQAVEHGRSLRNVADEYGLTAEGVRWICARGKVEQI